MGNKLVLIFIGIVITVFSFSRTAQAVENINLDDTQVVYPLPYPGILADHPLYSIKQIRDKIIIFTTRDNLKKAQLYLHLSDKHMSIALKMAEKGKEDLAKEELLKAENYFLKIPPLLKESKEQGNKASNDFISKLSQSNAKHREVIKEVMKNISEAEIDTFNTVLEKNETAAKEILKI